jgi:hypothetical protein
MRDEAARLASRFTRDSDTGAALNRIAFSPELESITEQDWRLLIDYAASEIEEKRKEYSWLVDLLNSLAEGCDGTLQCDAPPMTPEGVGALLNTIHCMSPIEFHLTVDRAVAAQKAQGYSTFAEFIFAMVEASEMAKVMDKAPQLTLMGLCGPDDYRRFEYIPEDADVQAMFREEQDALLRPRGAWGGRLSARSIAASGRRTESESSGRRSGSTG